MASDWNVIQGDGNRIRERICVICRALKQTASRYPSSSSLDHEVRQMAFPGRERVNVCVCVCHLHPLPAPSLCSLLSPCLLFSQRTSSSFIIHTACSNINNDYSGTANSCYIIRLQLSFFRFFNFTHTHILLIPPSSGFTVIPAAGGDITFTDDLMRQEKGCSASCFRMCYGDLREQHHYHET